MEMYNSFRNDLPLAVFNYNFDRLYPQISMQLFDSRMNFGMQVNMRHNADEVNFY